jgi:predicted Zn-dependent protease
MENNETKPKLRDVINIPVEVLDAARQTAYNLYQTEQWDQTETMLKGLLAADPTDAWALSLFAAMLRKQKRFKEALVVMETAHTLDPKNDNITRMRDEIVVFLQQVQKASGGAS